ncbi:hypothetical protein L1987_44144 [Smallanthus sonchifolius]|uniref:Uncharacterized protein n=1 Tax=Smallanthus sonchifolius TaxID=185202 RepID=A0ACB9GPL3_9ASTR|nr:hypothetical protein L1987_44144 [Smallanthus sonchifolius]
MSVIKPEVIVISSDDEDDGDGERKLDEGLQSEHDGDYSEIVISSDDEDDGDGERNLDEGLDSEHDGDCIKLDGHESDKEEGDDVEKPNEEECLDNCDDISDSLNQVLDPSMNVSSPCVIVHSIKESGQSVTGNNGLQELSLYECKTYLRKHGMRVTGTKEECIQRIKEHGRAWEGPVLANPGTPVHENVLLQLKDGSGKSLYPRSSFSINCTGDACRGDVVLFKQNMYDNHRNLIGRRTVVGRIANESYGASTQQHTFSPWESEEERSKVLREKHERGKAARHKRKLRETEFASGDNKGTKRRKVSHRGPYQSKHITRIDKQIDVNKNTTAPTQAEWFQNMELERSTQLTNHSDPNSFMYSDQHLQDTSLSSSYDRSLLPNNLLPSGFAGYSRNNNGQQGPNQAFSQPPDHHHHNHKPPVRRSTEEIAKSRFPKSLFSEIIVFHQLHCAGDARNGDIVLFKEHVYMGGNKGGKKRTVAGRIVKVRQCESKDKHKFLPWRNEANRSKMFKEKHGPATRKRKLKNTNVALDKNKGSKRQKGSHNGTSQNAKQNKKAKQKSSKRKGASATPLKETKTAHKEKAVQVNTESMNQMLLMPPCLDKDAIVSVTGYFSATSDVAKFVVICGILLTPTENLSHVYLEVHIHDRRFISRPHNFLRLREMMNEFVQEEVLKAYDHNFLLMKMPL